mmetsp:Transcript_124974/g.353743  ORF Transcript_124974/g.353743 Transcript_124974/m.353743 type:complete len:127 (-) Transcript_124974:12-392(-)
MYPGFTATLLPELESWSDQDLQVYFGSNGDIWPCGKRPSWVRRPNAVFEEAAAQERDKPKTYPELKKHFKTLNLAETTPPDVIQRHYRRLALQFHPDKHPEDVEAATEKFQAITAAWEAIKERMRL